MPQHSAIHLKDYTPYPFTVSAVHLTVELDPTQTKVTARSSFRRNPAAENQQAALELDGEHLELVSVALDGRRLAAEEYIFADGTLRIEAVPEQFELEIATRIAPASNTALEGLYLSSGNYCTQCEAEGFRRITCWPDRPDVMAVFTVTVIGPQASCPVLLSNGNLIEQGQFDDGRHFATWHDPFPKPSYLFALVAGQLVRIEDSFTTMSGREVSLHIYVEERNRDKCAHAMQSLKKAMRWDEEVFGREYDLDTYMIVAVDDFNMGAMENKGLNVFNSKYVLAQPETATDSDYEGIEAVIAHEYFHNWTGNRITCRDWFQLSLKEGLTVFRDQEFSADMGSRAVQRIQDANYIRNIQFREDSGPTAHPVRPASYVEINNFYTATVYNKGAEVIRMLHTLLGAAGFRKGMDLYFQRHDGQAVTCEDFVQAMQDANGFDLSQFQLWYNQAGTPSLRVSQEYDVADQDYVLTVSQSCPATPGQVEKQPFFMPVRIGLLDSSGKDIRDEVLLLDQETKEFRFTGIAAKPVLSFNRSFAAPVKVESDLQDEELAFLMAHDRDPFNRWDAGQQLGLRCLLQGIADWQQGRAAMLPELFQQAFARLLADEESDPAFPALALVLPAEGWISQQLAVIDPEAVFIVRQGFRSQLRQRHQAELLARYQQLSSAAPYCYSGDEAGRRSLRNCCLAYLSAAAPGEVVAADLLDLAVNQYRQADNMTDAAAALAVVVNADRAAGDALLAEFYAKWQHDPLVVDKRLILQATCSLPGTLQRVRELLLHPAFSMKNPNKVRSLIGAFGGNLRQFHAPDGSGYAFLADCVAELDPMNPQAAARLLTPLTQWKRYDADRQQLMRRTLEQIAALPGLSRDVSEVMAKSLQ
ncbi:MAG: aminopeptidase N [Candidatus Electronema aureum]|uniref:Aminopeptidase N n=1 Tax=Candidatus Electronema aureum TaxID=2005002 RepID=A0A521G180_9BACT|nr:MAG: aminopeptidase N [Candidatus Electronema aureum]